MTFTGKYSAWDLVKRQGQFLAASFGVALVAMFIGRNVLTVLAVAIAGYGAFTLMRELLLDVDAVAPGDDLRMWSLEVWRIIVGAVVVVALVGGLLLGLFHRSYLAFGAVIFTYAMSMLLLFFFISFRIRRRQKMVGIWRSK